MGVEPEKPVPSQSQKRSARVGLPVTRQAQALEGTVVGPNLLNAEIPCGSRRVQGLKGRGWLNAYRVLKSETQKQVLPGRGGGH